MFRRTLASLLILSSVGSVNAADVSAASAPRYVHPRDVQRAYDSSTTATTSVECPRKKWRKVTIEIVPVKLPSGEIKSYYKGAPDRLYLSIDAARDFMCDGK